MTNTWFEMIVALLIVGPLCAYRLGFASCSAERSLWAREAVSLAVLFVLAMAVARVGVVSAGSASLGGAIGLCAHFALAWRDARRLRAARRC